MANPVQQTGIPEPEQGSGAEWQQGAEEAQHPAAFNATPAWMIAAQNYAASILARHGFLILALGVAFVYLWPAVQRKLREALGRKPAVAAAGVARDASSAAAAGDVYAEQRRRAVEALQAKLEEDTKAALEEQALLGEAERRARLDQLDEEAKRMGLGHLVGSGHRLGTGDDKPWAPSAAPAAPRQQPARRPAAAASRPARRSGYNPLDSSGGVGGFRSTRNAGRGGG